MIGFQPFKSAKRWGWLTVTTAVLLLLVLPHKADHMPTGFFTPILYLELLSDVEIARQFIFEQSDPAFVTKMIWGNVLDFLFMISYSLFLYYFIRDCHRLLVRLKLYKLLRGWIFLILASDIIENMVLLRMLTGNPEDIAGAQLITLQISTWSKWLSLAGVLAGIGIQVKQAGRFGFAARLLSIPLMLLALAAFVKPAAFCEIFSLAITVELLLSFIIALRFRFTGMSAAKPF